MEGRVQWFDAKGEFGGVVWGKSAIGHIIIKHQWVCSLSGLKGLLFRLSGQMRREFMDRFGR